MQVIQLHEYSEKSVGELIARLRQAAQSDEPSVILDDGDVVGTLLSPDLGKEALATRLLKSLDCTPTLLDEILTRLDEEIVD